MLKLVRKEYHYADSIISTFFVLGVFDLELPFSDSLGTQRHKGGTRRIAAAVAANADAEVEHAYKRTNAIAAAAKEPSTARIREARVIRIPSA